ncbi:MAG: DNA alkylation response protein, partial [Microlunatus sp.]|nr:DNA alkylation response protein [Microlunatus sp.]
APRLARTLVETMALTLQASLLLREAPGYIADAFIAGRLSPARGLAYGALPTGVDLQQIIARA